MQVWGQQDMGTAGHRDAGMAMGCQTGETAQTWGGGWTSMAACQPCPPTHCQMKM